MNKPSSAAADLQGASPQACGTKYSSGLLFKRRAGRKKFRETRHPFYRGVRERSSSSSYSASNGGNGNGNSNGKIKMQYCKKWVCEVREPFRKTRIWLGTYPTPDLAARAYDVAALALKGDKATLNFPDSAMLAPRARSSSPTDIRVAVLQAMQATQAASSLSSSSSCSSNNIISSSIISTFTSNDNDNNHIIINDLENSEPAAYDDHSVTRSTSLFLDEEELFNMPALIDSMAEGMLLTPPCLKRGFSWDDCTTTNTSPVGDFNLWYQ